jgi:hypothetical protein
MKDEQNMNSRYFLSFFLKKRIENADEPKKIAHRSVPVARKRKIPPKISAATDLG